MTPKAITGSDRATTIGQYDGDGRWISEVSLTASPSGSSAVGAVVLPSSCTSVRRWSLPSSSSAYLRCHHSSRCVTVGSMSKLCAGGGEAVAHSSVLASHGSGSLVTFVRLRTTL